MPTGVWKRDHKKLFWSKVNLNGPIVSGMRTRCWLWTGATVRNGYGKLRIDLKYRLAHVVSYEWEKGKVPDGKQVNHHCDVRRCIRPSHLYAGTQKRNLQDSKDRGRLPMGPRHYNARLTTRQVEAIRRDPRKGVEVAKAFGICDSHVSQIRNGKARIHA